MRRWRPWCLLTFYAAAAAAQLAVRPDDPTGLSIRTPRERIVHTTTANEPGTSMHLQQTDPWLAYQLGRAYYFREWTTDDRVFGRLPTPIRPQSASTNSCGMCHNIPFPSGGAGGNSVAQVGVGLNAPHLFGAGLLETLAMQIRAQLLAEHDTNRNGYLDVPAEVEGRRAVVRPAPGVELDFGSLEDLDGNGMPDLNPMIQIRMVDLSGNRLGYGPGGSGRALLTDAGVLGYDFMVGVFGSSATDHTFASLRLFAGGVLANVMGILPEGSPLTRKAGLGFQLGIFGDSSNAGALLSELFLTSDPFAGGKVRPTITEGELDLFEWYLLNHPAPALGPENDRTRKGRANLDRFGCTSCHVADWVIEPRNDELGLPGDRRFFHLDARHNPATDRIEGRLVSLAHEEPVGEGVHGQVPRRDGFVVENVFTDLRHHDLGPKFRAYSLRDGQLVYSAQLFRTSPLWGVGSTAPYGHDGMSLTLDDVIRRHGGAAEESVAAYSAAPREDRQALIAFLRSLVLYVPQTLPTDLDGDGTVGPNHRVAGVEVGPEIFRPEFFFRTPPAYRGWTEEPGGHRYFSYEMLNVAEAYGIEAEPRGPSAPEPEVEVAAGAAGSRR